jgi:hypothetical protein
MLNVKLANFENISENLDIGALKSLCRNSFGQLITSEMYDKLEEVANKYNTGQFKIDTIKYEQVPEYISQHVGVRTILRQESREKDILEIASYKKPPKFLQVEHAEEEHKKVNPEMLVKTQAEVDMLIFQGFQKIGNSETQKRYENFKDIFENVIRDCSAKEVSRSNKVSTRC